MPLSHDGSTVKLNTGNQAIATFPVDEDGNYTPAGATTASTPSLANVNASASSVTLLEANTSRLGAIVYNDSGADLYLKYGSSASTTSFTYFVQANSPWEMPPGAVYTGIITGVWSSATGAARVTELT